MTTWKGRVPAFRTPENTRLNRSGSRPKNRTSGKEIWYADFDGNGHDQFCEWGLACSAQLPNNRESGIGGGDSGGPSFIEQYGELMLIATNTFGGTPDGLVDGAFGTYFGGIALHSYLDYLARATDGAIQVVSEPAGTLVFALGLFALAGARRRNQRH